MDDQQLAQEYTAAVLESRFATAGYLRDALPHDPNLEQHDCGGDRRRAVSGEIGGVIVYACS